MLKITVLIFIVLMFIYQLNHIFMLKFRHLLLAGALLASMKTSAHRIEYYTSNGCLTVGQSLAIDAYVVYAPSNTYYQWQFKGSSGGWTYLTNGNNTINGSSYAVSNATGGPTQDNAPALTFAAPNANLDGVQLRCLMRENYLPSSSSTNSPDIWGGDDENVSETKMLRIRYNATSGACAISCDDNLLTNTNGYYGGFEQVSYSNGNFTDNNWGSGEGSTDYPDNGGTFKVKNNPYAAYSSFSSAKFAPHSGNYQMVVTGSCNSTDRVWYKSVAVTTGQVYNFSVWVARVDNTTPTIQLKAGATQIGSAVISGSIGAWVQVTGTFTATSSTTVIFSILNSSASGGADNFVLDDICLTVYDPISIGDKVWWDVNRDGAQDAGEPGVNAVTVKLFPDSNNDNIGDNGTTPTATTTTNSSGIYSFTSIAPGKYFVQFILPSGYTGFTIQDAASVPLGSNSTANVTTGKTGTHDFNVDYDKKDAGLLKNLTISGNTYNDHSALIDNMVNGSLISAIGTSALHANLFKGSVFVATTPVSGGNYTFSNLAGNTNYTVVISTVPATAASTPTSTLASGWMSTGEFVGSGAGSDGTVDGKVNVSLVTSSISDVNFGMQQPPTANTATLPSQLNPGGVSFVAVPATNFGGADPGGGSISFVKLTSFPTNTATLKVNNVNYTSATFATVPNIPTNAAGQPTQPVSVDPIDGGISVVIPYQTIDDGGAISTNTGNVTVPLTVPPDLTPLITATPTTMHGITNFNVTIKVSEISGTATSGLITLYVPKDPRITFTYNGALTTIGSPAVALDNSDWTYNGTNQFFYIFTSTTVIPANESSTIGFAAQFNPLSAQGVYVLSSVIVSGSGGETKFSNNSSSVSLTYFAN
jgi:hypothetical protein